LYDSPNFVKVIPSRRMKFEGLIIYMEELKYAYRILIRKSEQKRPYGKSRHRREDNIKVDHRETE